MKPQGEGKIGSLWETLNMEVGFASTETGGKGTAESRVSSVGGPQQGTPWGQRLSPGLLYLPTAAPRSWHRKVIDW